MSGYTKRTIIGVSWMSGFRVVTRIIAFARIIILARILVPSQFGVFGIATMALALLEILTETGINVFLVQEKEDIKRYVNDAWLISIIRGILIAIFIILTAPYVASFFNIQQSIGLLFFISVVPFMRGFINPSEVTFQKELQFNKEFYFRTAIFGLDSLVAIIVSLITHSAVGLVFGLIAGTILEIILSFTIIKPIPTLDFNLQKLKKIFHSGKWVTLFGVFNYAASKGDSMAIGKILGPGPLGIYQIGYTIATMPVSEIADVANRVTFPVYSKISEELQRLKEGFIKTTLLVSAISILLGIIIFFFPRELFILIFGQKWADTMIVLKPLAIYGAIRGISNTASSLFLALGKQKYVAGITFLRFAVLAITIVPFTLSLGLLGAGYSVLLSGIVELIPIGYCIGLVFNPKKLITKP
jgi:O-antigen/teichoic acid export membrane protein